MCHQKSIGSQAENCHHQETRMLPDADWSISYHLSSIYQDLGGGGVACTNETQIMKWVLTKSQMEAELLKAIGFVTGCVFVDLIETKNSA